MTDHPGIWISDLELMRFATFRRDRVVIGAEVGIGAADANADC